MYPSGLGARHAYSVFTLRLSRFIPATAVLFALEYGRRDLTIPGVRRVELGTSKMKDGQGPRSPLRDAGRDLQMAYLRGNSLFLRDVFPDSFLVVHAETYAPQEDGPGSRKALGHTPQRVRNLLQINSLVECDLAVIATEWQRRGFPDLAGEGHGRPPAVRGHGFLFSRPWGGQGDRTPKCGGRVQPQAYDAGKPSTTSWTI